ncbi:MAG TPA: ATP-binding protein, partial [Pseudonocardiaceae bacterium]|nr:ATP-binding protein [Pseudonocardiaceae bacterium]
IAELATQQSNRLEDLIQQLLLLAKADEHRLGHNRTTVDIAALLHDVRATTLTHHIDLDLDVAADAVAVGNADQLGRLFRNLIDNAVRYATSTVRVTATVTGQRVVVEVADDGPGIPVADRDRIFDRFVRLDNSRDRNSGTTGLGLAIAREIATAHHGGISVADAHDGGARLIVWLPRAVQPTHATPAESVP